jgi:hypothetical protein
MQKGHWEEGEGEEATLGGGEVDNNYDMDG